MAAVGFTNILYPSQTEAPDCILSGNNRILLHSILIRLGCGVYLYSASVLASPPTGVLCLMPSSPRTPSSLPHISGSLLSTFKSLLCTPSSLPRTSRTFPPTLVTDGHPVGPYRVRFSDAHLVPSNYRPVGVQIVACGLL